MTNKPLTDRRVAEIRARAEIFDDSVLTDFADIAAAMYELQELRKQSDELTMWVKRLACSLKNAEQNSKLPRYAMDYLTAKGLVSVGDILR